MFDFEKIFSTKENISRLEWMDYDSRIFKIPIIFKRAVDMMFEYHTLTYSDFGGIERFRKLILSYEKRQSGLKKGHNPFVFVGSGVSSLIWPVLKSVFDLDKKKKKNVLLFFPDYPLFHSVVESLGGNPIIIKSSRNNDFLPTISQLRRAVKKGISAVIFSNPNNPTGRCLPESFIREIVELSKEHDFFILSDEIYGESLFDNKKMINIAKINNSYERYVKFFGLSKDRPGMTGLRCGYCIGDERLAHYIENVQIVRNLSNGIISEYLFLLDIALRYKNKWKYTHPDLKYYTKDEINEYFQTIKNNLKLQKKYTDEIISSLNNNNHVRDLIVPDGGNSVFFRYYKKLAGIDLVKEFLNKGIAIYPGEVFGLTAQKNGSWTRVCITRDVEFLKKIIKKI